jgi:hypothetical protein
MPSSATRLASCGFSKFLKDARIGIVTLTVAGQTFGRRMPRSCRSGHLPPLLRRLGAELAKRFSGDQIALDVEGVVNGGVGGQKSLR